MSAQVTAQHLRSAAKGPVDASNMNSVLGAVQKYGSLFGLERPHRAVQFYAQIMHESGDFRYDREIWGPTPAQARYDVRADLGNTPAKDGDGKKYMGRTAMQLTGKANYQAFTDWCEQQNMGAPNFVQNPDALNADPWEGLVTLWFWDGHGLNRWADQGDIETITKKINGGVNGLADRIDHYVRLALVVLGYPPAAVKQFQATAGLDQDGDPGPKTRAALHKALMALSGASSKQAGFMAAPVVDEKEVVPPSVEKQVKKRFNFFGWITSIFGGGGFGIAALTGFDWRALAVLVVAILIVGGLGLLLRRQILSAIKDIRQGLEDDAQASS